MFVTMALLSESEVAEAPTSAGGKLLKVQECALQGRTHAEGLGEGGVFLHAAVKE